MEKSLFHKETPEKPPPNPYDLIESEVSHLKKGTSVRHGPKAKQWTPPWLVIIAFCGLAWLYLMDPIYHAWYKGEAIKTYLYLHNYGAGSAATDLAACHILSAEDIDSLNHRTGSFQDYYSSPDAANKSAENIVEYMSSVALLHAGKYQPLDPVGRMRCFLFVRTGLILPTQWTFLDPEVSG